MRYVFLLTLFFVPSSSYAAVIISEVAWMGSVESANHEWIELHNTGATSVDVSDWQLSDGMNLTITLAGTIPAGSYVVLERTSEASALGTAFLIYTGALVNTGATLALRRADGGLEDQVAGGENWQSIGGDNTSKETAQYTASGWVTGAPTPGSANSGSAPPPEDNDPSPSSPNPPSPTSGSSSSSGSVSRSKQGETVPLVLPGITLALTVKGQTVGYVNQDINLEVTPSGVGKTISDSLIYQWNFGDGNGGVGKKVSHRFLYPGTYIVTVHGAFKRQEQLARHEITILPVTLSVTESPKGDVQINNDSPYEIDISGYTVRGERVFTFPPYSIMLPNQTITLPRKKVGGGTVRVFDAQGVSLTSSYEEDDEEYIDNSFPIEEDVWPVSSSVRDVSGWAAPTLGGQFGFLTAEAATEEVASEDVSAPPTTTKEALTPPAPNDDLWPYFALVAIIVLGLLGTMAKGPRNQIE